MVVSQSLFYSWTNLFFAKVSFYSLLLNSGSVAGIEFYLLLGFIVTTVSGYSYLLYSSFSPFRVKKSWNLYQEDLPCF